MNRKRLMFRRQLKAEQPCIRTLAGAIERIEKKARVWPQIAISALVSVVIGSVFLFLGNQYTKKISDESTIATQAALVNAANDFRREIQRAVFPDKFLVEIDIASRVGDKKSWGHSTGMVPPNPAHLDTYKLKAKSKDFKLRVRIHNGDERYPATNLLAAFYIDDTAFEQKVELFDRFIEGHGLAPPGSAWEPDEYSIHGSQRKLKGRKFMSIPLLPNEAINYCWLNLSLKEPSGFFMVKVRDKIWPVKIDLDN